LRGKKGRGGRLTIETVLYFIVPAEDKLKGVGTSPERIRPTKENVFGGGLKSLTRGGGFGGKIWRVFRFRKGPFPEEM